MLGAYEKIIPGPIFSTQKYSEHVSFFRRCTFDPPVGGNGEKKDEKKD